MAKKIDLAEGLTHFKAKENASIAITEATSTASAPHKAGEYFYYKGDLVIATADIAQGGTITLNTNCKKQPLADSVCELKTAVVDVVDVSSEKSAKANIYPDVTAMVVKVFPDATPVYSTYIPVTPDYTYTVKKPDATTRFAIATTAITPAYNVPLINATRDDSAKSLTITPTGASKYLLIWFYRSNDSGFNPDTVLGNLVITEFRGAKDIYARKDIASLDSDIDILDGEIKVTTKDKTLVNKASTPQSGAYAATRRWFLDTSISGGLFISKIIFRTNSTVGTTQFELWEKDNDGTLSKYFASSMSSGATGENTLPVNVVTHNNTYISFVSDAQVVAYITGGDYDTLASTDVDPDTDELEYSDMSAFSGYTPCITVYYKTSASAKMPNNVVYIGKGQDYEEIQSALLDITDDSASNPYTFIVIPKGTPYAPFTMLRNSFTDTYPWTNSEPRHISIIGVDRANCVIRSDSGDYNLPCAEILTNGIIKNLKFVMTNDEQTETAVRGGYCMHIDSRTKNDVGYNLTIEDCEFEDASNACLGIGVHENCDLKIVRCKMTTTLSSNYNPHADYENKVNNGCVFAHSSTLANAQNQHLTLVGCIGVCSEGNKSIQISSSGDYDPSTAEFTYTLISNVFWNKTLNSAGWSISNNLTADPMNFGNNNS